MKDYYQILGILETASQEDIRQAYLRMALVWHPDRHTGEPPERIAIVTACFQEIGEAYGVLSDPSRKADYDWRRRQIRATPLQRPARPSSSASAPSRPCSSTSETGRRDSSFSRAHNWGTAYGRQTSRAQETSGGRESIADVLGYFFFSLLVVVLLNWGLFREAAYQIRDSVVKNTTPWSYSTSTTTKGARNINEIMKDLMQFPELTTMDVAIPVPNQASESVLEQSSQALKYETTR